MRPLGRSLAVFVAGMSSACASASQAPTPAGGATGAAITPADLERRLFAIAHDSMMGRETGSEGDFKAAAYIASEFRRLGLRPAGDSGTYFQTVPMWRVAVDMQSRIDVGGTMLEVKRDFLPATPPTTLRVLDAVQAIFAGSLGDTTRWVPPELARGKIVVLDLSPAMSMRFVPVNRQRWPGAAAIALVNLEQVGTEGISRLVEGRPVPDSSLNAVVTPVLWLSRRAAAVLLGGPPESLTPGAVGPKLDARFGFASTRVPFPARNVVAILPGRDPALRGQYVALTAHNDHVGFDHSPVDHDSVRAFNRVVRPMGADSPTRGATSEESTRVRAILDSLRRVHPPRLDSIRNGADDDGSGTVSMLEIAEAVALAAERPRRSLLFVSHTGEEAGLLGSAWFTDHATVPTDSIVAEIDQDMVGRGLATDFPRQGTGAGSPTYLEVIGDQKLSREFAAMLEAANARQPVPFVFDRTFAQPGHPLQYYCRADHYNYARYGIPAVALSRGEHLDYHEVTDEPQYISYPDLARVSRLVFDAVVSIANADRRPSLDAPRPADPHVRCRQ